MKIIQTIIKFFKNLIKNYKTNKLIKELEPIAKKKVTDRTLLKYEVTQWIWNYRKLHGSLYIPLDWKTKSLIKHNVIKKFGKEMRSLNVKLNNKLQVV